MDFRLCDLVELFLAGHDDKVYVDLQYDEFNVIQENVRIISNTIEEYKNNKVYALQECNGRLAVFIERGEKNGEKMEG